MFEQVVLESMSNSTVSPSDPWCELANGPLWDGLDFSPCFRRKALNGIVPVAFLILSFLSLLATILYKWVKRTRTPVNLPLGRESSRRLSISSRNRRLSTSSHHSTGALSVEIKTTGPSAIAEAENEVILGVVEEESPDLDERQVWAMGNIQSSRASQSNGLRGSPDFPITEEQDSELEDRSVSLFSVCAKAFLATKKDVLNVLSAAALVGLLSVKYMWSLSSDGSTWLVFIVLAWCWTFLLTLFKLALSYSNELTRLRTPFAGVRLSSFYTLLELNIIPWLFVFSGVAFFDLRSAILSFHSPPSPADVEGVRLEAAIFTVGLLFLLLELFSPRPSRFAPRSNLLEGNKPQLLQSPEINACLFSYWTFSFIDPFMFKIAFPSANSPPYSMEVVPDLRPDDKTARTLLQFRRDSARLNSGYGGKRWGLAIQLVWHFKGFLLQQQLWAYLSVATVALPPLFLQGLLGHIGRRQRGEDAPLHVAFLYAAAMFFFQNVLSLSRSQSLYIGRRICIRLRAIIIGEVFTKALRRKDMAGSSAIKEEKGNDVSQEDTEENNQKKSKKEEQEIEKASTGKILNLISVDTYRLSEICAYLHFIWPELSLTIIVTVALLFNLLGWSAAAGLGVLILITPLQAYNSKAFYKHQKRLLEAADARLSLATEVLSSIRIVKYFAWEKKFLEKMEETRKQELDALWDRAVTMVWGGVLMFGAPVIVSVATFTFHTKVLHRPLTAETAFTALAFFNILRGPLEGFTDMIVNVLQAYVSLKRIDEFLTEEETAKYTILRAPKGSTDPVIGFRDAEFTWSNESLAQDDSSIFRVKNLNLNFPPGEFSIIFGAVGSGKTTLLMSLLGETNCLKGSAFLPSPVVRSTSADPSFLTDTTAYCSQSAWLLSDTIRQNIFFGSPVNDERYKAVIEACALQPDLEQFELGDETEVGEKGTVLSGGQKARISLARAIYSPAKHILLDDVLSAVDAHTAQHLVNKCFKGRLMRHRTCILVTHAVELCLSSASFAVCMDNGSIITAGPPDQFALGDKTTLYKGDDSLASAISLASAVTIEAVASGETDERVAALQAEEKKKRQEKLRLVKEETQKEGSVSLDVYALYLKAMGGWWLAAISLSIFVLAQLSEICVSLALRYWAGAYDQNKHLVFLFADSAKSSIHRLIHIPDYSATYLNLINRDPYTLEQPQRSPDFWLYLYCGLAIVNLSLYGARVAFFLGRGVVASRVIYVELINRILDAPIRFFDSTPTGRILNRLSKDIETIDQDLAMVGMFFLLEILGVIGIIGTISSVLPSFLFAAVLITLTYWAMGVIYLSSSRELKRSDSVTKSPIFGLFGETLNGVATIRAYGDSARFAKQVFALLNINNRPFYTLWQGNRWLSVRVDFAGSLVTFAAALFVLHAKSMDAALAGFILSFAIAFNERILWVVRLWSQIEITFNSVERVREYMQLEQESQTGCTPPAIWPSRDGGIEVENLTATYSPELPPALKGVSFKVLPREKIGICGRTGSGKSTLGLSFFRFIEPSAGRIVIDGLDINTLKLPDLRSRLTIVAQESALFAGTLRFNMDPFGSYEDPEIWDALRRVGVTTSGSSPKATPGPSRPNSIKGSSNDGEMPDQDSDLTATEDRSVVKSLEMVVTEGGKNFSAGQRQLLALARGILKLRSSSILILDESTASLDGATDERIQKTIREEMAEATILCIAHRLRTIIDYDKILVLGGGEVLEFDTPSVLLSREDSVFSDLCKKSGEFEALLQLAHAARDSKAQS